MWEENKRGSNNNRYIKFDKEVDLSLRPRLKGVGYRLLVVKGKTKDKDILICEKIKFVKIGRRRRQ